MLPESGFRISLNWPEIGYMTMTSQFSEMTSSSNFFDVVLFLLSILITNIQYHHLFWSYDNFLLIRDWPEIRKSKIPPSKFCLISGDWDELGIANLARISLMKCYWMLQNTRGTAFTVSELLRENQQGGKIIPPPSLTD